MFESYGYRAVVTFGLNALYGRHQIRKGVWGGAWDSTNANNFMKYTVSKGYQIDSWEFGRILQENLLFLLTIVFCLIFIHPSHLMPSQVMS